MQQLVCLSGDLGSLSNHWEAGVCREQRKLEGLTLLLWDMRGRSHPPPPSPSPAGLTLGHWWVIHQVAPDRVTTE